MVKNNQLSKKRSCYHLIAPLALLPVMIFLKPCEAATSSKHYYIQIGAFKSQHSAEALLHSFKKKHVSGRLFSAIVKDRPLYEVQVGPYLNRGEANSKRRQLGLGFVRSYPATHSQQALTQQPQRVFHHPRKETKIIVSTTSRLKTVAGSLVAMPYYTRAYGEGTWGQQTSFGNGDLMVPIIGNNDWIGYVDGAGKYGADRAWLGSAGLGLRMDEQSYILGGYLFGDYNQSTRGRKFWVANPGIEFFTNTWDATLNGYIPTSSKTSSFGIYPGHTLGYDQAIHVGGHQLNEDYYNSLEAVGPGADFEVGYTIKEAYFARPFIGTYYFNPKKATNFVGIEGGIEIPVNHFFTVVIKDAYDKTQGNTVMGALRILLDKNTPATAHSLHSRLYDPFRRHRGAQQTGAGIPIVKTNQFVGTKSLYSNAWFFTPDGSTFNPAAGIANCTFEHPCGEMSQNTLNGINSLALNASLLIESGTYNNPLVGSGLQLLQGQSMHGRMAQFRQAAQGINRPLFNDSLILNGNNTVENLSIYANSTIDGAQVGIDVRGSGFTSIVNTEIASVVNNSVMNAVGISSQNNAVNLMVSNSQINARVLNSPTYLASGIIANNTSSLNLNNNVVQTLGLDSDGALGVSIANTNAQINNSTINVFSNHRKLNGLLASDNANITINGSNIVATGAFGDAQNASSSSYAVRNTAGANLNINNSSLTLNATNFINSALTALDQDGGNFNIQDSHVTLNATNSGTYVSGVNVNNGLANVLRTKINLKLDNSGTPAFNYGVNGSSNSHLFLHDVDIRVLSKNIPGGLVQGIQNSGTLAYGNTTVLVVASSPAHAATFFGNQPINLGNVFCLSIQNGVPTLGGCP